MRAESERREDADLPFPLLRDAIRESFVVAVLERRKREGDEAGGWKERERKREEGAEGGKGCDRTLITPASSLGLRCMCVCTRWVRETGLLHACMHACVCVSACTHMHVDKEAREWERFALQGSKA